MEEVRSGQAPSPVLESRGRGGELFAIFIVNVLLTIVTIGFYRFWAKTRVRRYLWANMSYDDEGLEYSGTGKELFLGFLIVVFLVLIPLFGGFELLGFYLQLAAPELVFIPNFLQLAAVAYLFPVAVYRARRYRLSRTQWRGIRGAQTGSAWKYGLLVLWYYFLTGLTLGMAWPLARTRLMAYRMNNTWFGDRRFQFDAPAGPLYRPFLKVCAVYLGVLILPVLLVALIGVAVAQEADPGADPFELPARMWWALDLWAVVLVIVVLIFFRIPWFWYRAAEYRYFSSRTKYESLDFSSTVTGWELTKLLIGNAALLVLTFGLALPVVYLRVTGFISRHLQASGERDLSAVIQSTRERPSTGEGLADAFEVGDF